MQRLIAAIAAVILVVAIAAAVLVSFPGTPTGTPPGTPHAGETRAKDGQRVRAPVPRPESFEGMQPLVRVAVEEALDFVESNATPAAWTILAETYHANDYVDLALPAYDTTIEAIGRDGEPHPRLYYLRARTNAELGNVDAALADIDRALRRAGDVSHVHWRGGFWLVEAGRLDEAEAAFDRALECDPEDPIPWVGRARIAMERGDAARAAGILEQLLDGGAAIPNAAYVRDLLGRAYQRLGRSEEAEPLLATAALGSLAWPDDWSNQMYTRRRTERWLLSQAETAIVGGDPSAALLILADLAPHAPDDPDLLKLRALAHFAAGQTPTAIALLERAAELSPDDPAIFLNLAHCHESIGAYGQALPRSARAAELAPDDPAVTTQHGRLLLRTGQPAAAAQAFQRTLGVNPGWAPAHLLLADAYAALGKRALARAELNTARMIDPMLPGLAETEARIDAMPTDDDAT